MIFHAVPLLTAAERADARRLIEAQGLSFEDDADDFVGIYDAGRLVAVGARAGYVLKMFAIDPAHQGGDALGTLATTLTELGRTAGHDTVFVYTRPEHAQSFEQCQFRMLVDNGPVTLLECGPGLEAYLESHRDVIRPGLNGAVVVNGNPFTRGHLHLVEKAADHVDTLYLFVVREDRSVFPFDARLRLAREATSHLSNVAVLETSRYAVSAGTFPSYFLKKTDEKARLQMEVDARLFATRLAPVFDIRERLVGTEPYCETTALYNQVMSEVLPLFGIGIVEVKRVGDDRGVFSATRVREALAAGDLAAVETMVPPATMAYLQSAEGRAVARRLRAAGPSPRSGQP
jgi:[citrate (pro-3S)-lyase] ligase